MIRVLIADDSSTARTLLVEILRSDRELQIVGEACDGTEVVKLAQKLRPDVITMDVHMPNMDGLSATKEIMTTVPTPIVILTASMESQYVDLAMHALRAGAVAVLSKPHGPGSDHFEECLRKLIATIKSMAQVKVVRHWRTPSARAPVSPPVARRDVRARIAAIAASTGGPAALEAILSRLPGSFPVPVLVVQHITPGFTPGLARWLNSICDLHVKVAEQGEVLAGHTVYIAPDDRHLGVAGGNSVLLSNSPPVGGFRPSATFLFESVARAFGAATAALILTGMGEDGVEGLRAVRGASGFVMAQNETSCVIYGMPGVAVAAGLADQVLPLEEIPARLLEVV